MTREELRKTVQMALDAIDAAETEAMAKVISRDKIAESMTLTLADAWAEVAVMLGGKTYRSIEMKLMDFGTGAGTEVTWTYYDEKFGSHVTGPDLKTMLAQVKAVKQAGDAKPQTLDDALVALDFPPTPEQAERLANF